MMWWCSDDSALMVLPEAEAGDGEGGIQVVELVLLPLKLHETTGDGCRLFHTFTYISLLYTMAKFVSGCLPLLVPA
jgi:hypothetical protein